MTSSQSDNYFNKIIVVGASRGVGAAVAKHILPRTKELITVSRTASIADWIEADISTQAGVTKVSNAVGNSTLDALLYMGGTWESEAFTSNYSFEDKERSRSGKCNCRKFTRADTFSKIFATCIETG